MRSDAEELIGGEGNELVRSISLDGDRWLMIQYTIDGEDVRRSIDIFQNL